MYVFSSRQTFFPTDNTKGTTNTKDTKFAKQNIKSVNQNTKYVNQNNEYAKQKKQVRQTRYQVRQPNKMWMCISKYKFTLFCLVDRPTQLICISDIYLFLVSSDPLYG